MAIDKSKFKSIEINFHETRKSIAAPSYAPRRLTIAAIACLALALTAGSLVLVSQMGWAKTLLANKKLILLVCAPTGGIALLASPTLILAAKIRSYRPTADISMVTWNVGNGLGDYIGGKADSNADYEEKFNNDEDQRNIQQKEYELVEKNIPFIPSQQAFIALQEVGENDPKEILATLNRTHHVIQTPDAAIALDPQIFTPLEDSAFVFKNHLYVRVQHVASRKFLTLCSAHTKGFSFEVPHKVKTKKGPKVVPWNAHVGNGFLTKVINKIAEHTTVIMAGDFNAMNTTTVIDGQEMDLSGGRFKLLEERGFSVASPEGYTCRTTHIPTATLFERRLDHIASRGKVAITNVQVGSDKNHGSDHQPVFATLAI